MLAWDSWGIVRGRKPGDPIPEEMALRLNTLAALIADPQADWKEIREIYMREDFRVPPKVLSFQPTGPAEVAVPE
jgi:hypothetical protein